MAEGAEAYNVRIARAMQRFPGDRTGLKEGSFTEYGLRPLLRGWSQVGHAG